MSSAFYNYNYIFKSILIGDTNVGKSALLRQFCHGTFQSLHELTIGVELDFKIIQVYDKNIKLHVWDTAGLERFHAITRTYFKNCAIVFIVFDVCNRTSFENVFSKWISSVKAHCHPKCHYILIGNKSDQEFRREVTFDEVVRKISHFDIDYIEISSKTNHNVSFAFHSSAKAVYEKLSSLSEKEKKEMGIEASETERINQIKPEVLHGPMPQCCIIH